MGLSFLCQKKNFNKKSQTLNIISDSSWRFWTVPFRERNMALILGWRMKTFTSLTQRKAAEERWRLWKKKIQLRSNCYQFCHIYCSCNKYTYYCFFKNLLYSKFLFVSKNVIGCLRLRAPSLIVRPTNCLYFPNFWLSNLICRVLELWCKNPIKKKKKPLSHFPSWRVDSLYSYVWMWVWVK